MYATNFVAKSFVFLSFSSENIYTNYAAQSKFVKLSVSLNFGTLKFTEIPNPDRKSVSLFVLFCGHIHILLAKWPGRAQTNKSLKDSQVIWPSMRLI